MKRPEWPQYKWISWRKLPGWDRPEIIYGWVDQDGRAAPTPEWAKKRANSGAGAAKGGSDKGKAVEAEKGPETPLQGKLL